MSLPLIIAGFHRSGTSLVSQLLGSAGLFLGDELLDALPSNPYGHFEDVAFVNLHERILRDNQMMWIVDKPFVPVIGERRWAEMSDLAYDRNIRYPVWGFKDPRVCLFLPHWKFLMPNAKTLIVYRHFTEATHSLERRHAEDIFNGVGPYETHMRFWREPDLALRMWLLYNQALVTFARAHNDDVLVISLDALRRGAPLVRMLNDRWDVGLDPVPTLEVLDPALAVRRAGRQPVSDRSLIAPLEDLWSDLQSLEASQFEGKVANVGE